MKETIDKPFGVISEKERTLRYSKTNAKNNYEQTQNNCFPNFSVMTNFVNKVDLKFMWWAVYPLDTFKWEEKDSHKSPFTNVLEPIILVPDKCKLYVAPHTKRQGKYLLSLFSFHALSMLYFHEYFGLFRISYGYRTWL